MNRQYFVIKKPILPQIKGYVKQIYGYTLLLFILNKFLLRPWARALEIDPLLILVNSFPNFAEAVIGTLLVVGWLMLGNIYFQLKVLRGRHLYITGTFLAGIYVITQELKIHNLGGRNVYDPNDLIASIIGLIFIFLIVSRYGVINTESIAR